jgi:hypothetical protein
LLGSMKTLNSSNVVRKAASEFCVDFAALSLVDCSKNPLRFTRHRRLAELFF